MAKSKTDVTIIDGICGSGKTTAAIDLIKKLSIPLESYGGRLEDKFIFVTPFIMEAHRIAGSIPVDIPTQFADDPTYEGYEISEYSEFDEDINKNQRQKDGEILYRKNAPTDRKFILPKSTGDGILAAAKLVIQNGKDLVITHATFSNFDKELLDLIKYNDSVKYHLIIDEVPPVFEMLKNTGIKISQDDINTLYSMGSLSIDAEDFVSWVETEKVKKLDEYLALKNLCDQRRIVQYTDKKGTLLLMKRQLPDTFKLFKTVSILTYLFDGSICKSYFDLYGITHKSMIISNSKTRDTKYWELIQLHNHYNKEINTLKNNALSKSWYLSNKKNLTELKTVTSNFFNNNRKVNLDERLWTVFKDFRDAVGGSGYKKRFLVLNSRATNIHKDVKSMAYLVNLYPYTPISNYFAKKGVKIDNDEYALAEMIQWIFRGQIRDGKQINLFLPSPRMKKILLDWMEELKKEYEKVNP